MRRKTSRRLLARGKTTVRGQGWTERTRRKSDTRRRVRLKSRFRSAQMAPPWKSSTRACSASSRRGRMKIPGRISPLATTRMTARRRRRRRWTTRLLRLWKRWISTSRPASPSRSTRASPSSSKSTSRKSRRTSSTSQSRRCTSSSLRRTRTKRCATRRMPRTTARSPLSTCFCTSLCFKGTASRRSPSKTSGPCSLPSKSMPACRNASTCSAASSATPPTLWTSASSRFISGCT
mmetsp:Transcript_17152/g.56143  ORF Transcript_17152/g.56143 Transcript_17152/m.56143 type:complete len:235 (+) Transcript_17152:2900-3604(+)